MDTRTIECPICLKFYGERIFQCPTGHSICESCNSLLTTCPNCGQNMGNNRNIDLEKLVRSIKDSVKINCENKNCTYKQTIDILDEHRKECKYRRHYCHGKTFSGWNCDWYGAYEDLLEHYQKKHPNNSRMPAVTRDLIIRYDQFNDSRDTQIISFLNGKQLLYFKHKIDKKKQMAYWIFQFVGPKHEAKNYMYEFEINKDSKKYKITDVCFGDVEDCEEIMDKEKCICMSLKKLETYLDSERDLSVSFRVFNNHPKKQITEINRGIKSLDL